MEERFKPRFVSSCPVGTRVGGCYVLVL